MFPYISVENTKVFNLITNNEMVQSNVLYYNPREKVYFIVNTHGFLRVYSKIHTENQWLIQESELTKESEFVVINKDFYRYEEDADKFFNSAIHLSMTG